MFSSNAIAALSQGSFAYTGGPPTPTTLLINGGTTLSATNRGWIRSDGLNNGGGADNNYFVGICGSSDICGGDDFDRNNYFTFDLSSIGAVSSAVLFLTQPGDAVVQGYVSSKPSHVYTVWDTLVDPSLISGTNNASLFTDLSGGMSFGSVVVDPTTNGTKVGITFNAAGLSALNAAVGAGGQVAFGGSLNINTSSVPEPATWAMMIMGFGLMGAAMRRRENVSVTYA